MTAKGSAPLRLSGGGGRSLCAEVAPGSRRWGAAARPWTPDNSARGGEPRGPETLTWSPGRRRRQRPGAPSWARPSRPRSGRSEGCRGGTSPGEGARGGSARLPTAREAAHGSLPRGRLRHRPAGRACHGGGAQPRARPLGLGLLGPLLRPPPRLHLLQPVALRLLLLDRRPHTVMGTGTAAPGWGRLGCGGNGVLPPHPATNSLLQT